MKLTKREIEEILENYNIGKLKKFSLIKGGLVNYNYIVDTDKGKYIIRIVGDNSKLKLKQLEVQFKVLSYLKAHKFPYLIPNPIKSVNLKEILEINKKRIWIYAMINGTNRDRPNISEIKQIAKTLATYHTYIKGLYGKAIKDGSKKRLRDGFNKMKNIRVKNTEDRLALKYRNYFKDLFRELSKLNFSINMIYTHNDFDASNVLFDKGKLKAIIDFDEVSYSPRVFDVTVSIRDSCCTNGKLDIKKVKIFLREYEKIVKLHKKEKDMIIPLMLYANIDFFVWAYNYMKKEKENRKKYMKEMIILTKDIITNNKNLK